MHTSTCIHPSRQTHIITHLYPNHTVIVSPLHLLLVASGTLPHMPTFTDELCTPLIGISPKSKTTRSCCKQVQSIQNRWKNSSEFIILIVGKAWCCGTFSRPDPPTARCFAQVTTSNPETFQQFLKDHPEDGVTSTFPTFETPNVRMPMGYNVQHMQMRKSFGVKQWVLNAWPCI